MKVLLYACEQSYGGYHGIEDYCVMEFPDGTDLNKIYREYVVPMSFEVMDSYCSIMEDIYEEALCYTEEDSDEFGEIVDEIMHERVEGYVAPIKNDEGKTVKELDSELGDLGTELFRERYC